jgi:glycosyltransferase involved in cell wall biosynthesis
MEELDVAIHGHGQCHAYLHGLAQEYQNVVVTGSYKPQESEALYAYTDVLYAVYPSGNEQDRNGLPIKLYEAIETKTPIIVTRASTALAEFVDLHQIGFVLEELSAEALRNLFRQLQEDKHIISDKADNLSQLRGKFRWDEVVCNLDYIYQ